MNYENIEFNEYQSSIEELKLESYPEEIQEQFFDYINNVPFIKYMVSKDRPHACDLPRDKDGKIVFDVAHPPLLDDMDYFRPALKIFKKIGRYTELRPNPNPNSDYGKWVREEIRRCYEGMVRPSDGMWITGDMYFMLNYFPMYITKITENSKKGERVFDFPEVWEGINMRFHYIHQAIHGGMYNPKGGCNGCEISSRGKSKSYSMASILARMFILGESKDVNKGVKCLATAYIKEYLNVDGILNKFKDAIDYLAINTQFPRRKIKNSMNEMEWMMGYIDLDTGARKGTLNTVTGLAAKEDIKKIRGKRQNFIIVEEFGSFPNILNMYNVMIPSVQEGDISFGTIYLIGTAGDKDSDFRGAQEIVYYPSGYNMYSLPNVFDKEGLGRKDITFFFPGYLNRKGCYDKDGNSDITKALLEILVNRYNVKHNSSDVNTITKTIAEIPITPQEAILRSKGNMFPAALINDRLLEIDNDPKFFDDVYVGTLVQEKSGNIKFVSTGDEPIRDFPLKTENTHGALEIYQMPQKNREGKIASNRYIIGHDPVDDDTVSDSVSLTSTIVIDLFTDLPVAEYTGRMDFADENFEMVRLLCLFYNAKCMYEQNKKGIFSYFSRMNCVYLLAETPEYLKDKQIIKDIGYGNKSRGVVATLPVNNYANERIRDWLLTPKMISEGEEQVSVPIVRLIKNRALLKELVLFNPNINVDRVRALGMAMLYRESLMILYNGDVAANMSKELGSDLAKDKFFEKNYRSKRHVRHLGL